MQNVTGAAPTVNTSGTPLRRDGHRAAVKRSAYFGRDPNRPGPDPPDRSKILALKPPPNNYLVGDGLNTAGFLWSRPVIDDFQLYEGRVDHHLQ